MRGSAVASSPLGERIEERGSRPRKRMLPMIESLCGKLPLSIPSLRDGPLPLPKGRGKRVGRFTRLPCRPFAPEYRFFCPALLYPDNLASGSTREEMAADG